MIQQLIEDYLFFPLTKSLAERLVMRTPRKSLLQSIFVIVSYLLIDKTARKAFRAGQRKANTEADLGISNLIGYMNGVEDLEDLENCVEWLYNMSVEDEPNYLDIARQRITSERFKHLLEAIKCQRRTVERLQKCHG